MQNKKILVGVTGGIAIYKICDLVRRLVKKDYSVKMMMTENAAKLVSALVFHSLSRSTVYVDGYGMAKEEGAGHIVLAKWADAVVVAPATANTIGKFVNGIADNFVTTTLMAVPDETPLFIAPAMNANMWNNIFVRENMKKLIIRKNCHIIGPEAGMLADGSRGLGRMAEPETIMRSIEESIDGPNGNI
jgi:phosphopantothenoylcysteine decarboxylase / phosphopantothenate---cysteine ligase